MNKKTFIIIAIVIVLLIGGYLLWRSLSGENLNVTGGSSETPAVFPNSSAGV